MTLSGIGLHGGRACSVAIGVIDGPTTIETESCRMVLERPTIVRADQGVRLRLHGGDEIDLVEHLAAAIGGMGLHRGVRLQVTGGEVPLMDGGARAFVEALLSLGATPRRSPLRVARAMSFSKGDTTYELVPGDDTHIEVDIDFDHPRIGRQRAIWEGDSADFQQRIAPARTFGFARDLASLRRAGRALHVDLASVVVFDEQDVMSGCELRGDDEPARHKLLDLVGDLALHGGPPRGKVRASRPGHAATHAFICEAMAAGCLEREERT